MRFPSSSVWAGIRTSNTHRCISYPQGTLQTAGRMPLAQNLIEDSFGWEQATEIPVRGAGRTCEIRSGEDWVALCREHS